MAILCPTVVKHEGNRFASESLRLLSFEVLSESYASAAGPPVFDAWHSGGLEALRLLRDRKLSDFP